MTDEVKEEVVEETKETPEEVVEDEVVEEDKVDEVVDVSKVEVEIRKKDDEKIDYGEDIDPEDIKTIGTIVAKQTESIKNQLQDTKIKLEVDSFLQERPEFLKYKQTILKYVDYVDKDGSKPFSRMTIKNLAVIASADDLLKIGAQKEREAQAKVSATKTPGTGARTTGDSATDWLKAPKNDFEAKKREVLQRR